MGEVTAWYYWVSLLVSIASSLFVVFTWLIGGARRFGKLEEKIEGLEGGLEKRIENVEKSLEKRIEGVEESIGRLEGRVDNLFLVMTMPLRTLQHHPELHAQVGKDVGVAKSESPLVLTDSGRRKLALCRGERIIHEYWTQIEKKLKETLGTNRKRHHYHIQHAAFTLASSIDKIISDEDFGLLQLAAYKEGFPMKEYEYILGIPIRNKYLALQGMDVNVPDELLGGGQEKG